MGTVINLSGNGTRGDVPTSIEINGVMAEIDRDIRKIEREIAALQKRRRKLLTEYQKLVPVRLKTIIATGIVVGALAGTLEPLAALRHCGLGDYHMGGVRLALCDGVIEGTLSLQGAPMPL